jgi:trehalose utilization protein
MTLPVRVTVWNEFRHEKKNPKVTEVYPKGMHAVIAESIAKLPNVEVRTATLDEPEHGLTDEVLNNTDVLTWWGHTAHKEVKDEIVAKVQKRVWQGMGLIVLHSGHFAKIFKALMGTGCDLKWREAGEKEILWVTKPGHPIVEGLDDHFTLEHTEMYGEHFDIPEPDELIFISSFAGGEVFRSGCTFQRGNGRIFYFRPGHETYPIFYDKNVQRVINNAVLWAAPKRECPKQTYGNRKMGWIG